QLVAELAGDLRLELFDLLGGELDHLAVAQIDEVVVMAVAHRLVARAALAEIVTLDDAGVLEQLCGATNRRDRDLVVDGDTAAVEYFDIGMVDRFREHAGDDAALL